MTEVSSVGGGDRQRRLAVSVVLVEAWSRFAQPYSAFDMGDLRVLQMARQSLDWPRHRVLHKSPHLKSLRSAAGQTVTKSALFDTVRHLVMPLFAHSRVFASSPPATFIGESRRLTASLSLRRCRAA